MEYGKKNRLLKIYLNPVIYFNMAGFFICKKIALCFFNKNENFKQKLFRKIFFYGVELAFSIILLCLKMH